MILHLQVTFFLINLRAGLEPVTSLLKLSVKQLQCETFA